jgi:hypothetical protein
MDRFYFCFDRNLYFSARFQADLFFAAWEQPEIFSQEMRAAFKSLR